MFPPRIVENKKELDNKLKKNPLTNQKIKEACNILRGGNKIVG